MPSFEIRPLTEGDWPVLRDLRTRALAEAPDAFGPTLETANEQTEEYWRRWAAGRPGRLQAWAAFESGRAVGLISAGIPSAGRAHFGAVWVAPAARGGGLARHLVETVNDWAREHDCRRIELEVTDGNGAERLYETLGFRRTGARKPLRDGSALEEVTMALELTPGSA